MKIGIITFHKSDNYGSVLQTFALQAFINKHFIDITAEVIDFYPPKLQNVNRLYEPVKGIKDIAKNIVKSRLGSIYKLRRKTFENFRKENINISTKKYDDGNINLAGEIYDVIIVGSDQIWNPFCLEFSWSYYLRNVHKCVKISYAPSLGTCDIDKKSEVNICELLNEFDCISVREQQGAEYLSDLLNKSVESVPDPTLLLSSDEYEKLSLRKLSDKEYIFLYVINTDPLAIEKAVKISGQMSLPIYTVVSCANSFRLLKYHSIHFIKEESPTDFMAYIKNAKIVLTNSFHGTVFSIIFRKNFYVLGNLDDNGKDNRIYTLLNRVGLLERCTDIIKKEFKDYGNINYKDVDVKLAQYRNDGIKYLENAITLAKKQTNS